MMSQHSPSNDYDLWESIRLQHDFFKALLFGADFVPDPLELDRYGLYIQVITGSRSGCFKSSPFHLELIWFHYQSWRDDNDCSDPSSSKGPSSFKRQYWDNGAKRNSSQRHPQWETFRGSGKGGFHFVYNVEEDLDTIFQSAFVGERFSYQSFVNGDDRSQTGNSHRYSSNHKTSSNWRYRSEDDYRTYKDFSENSDPDLSSDRSILGLSTYGPLKLEDVKTAYRTCALKWHPDRHQGSTKPATSRTSNAIWLSVRPASPRP
ncbi:hypothetical protein GIB67_010404 [Kingdonia uniflora]|uniref:J domain-containing protein n=1 Tax=Kingdonia uniflora TaxID=39325 RepID=A0A7J7MAM9_9MAGN|nr:hypothetical protein GIB67_010404 [Kingdonia uniflora]